MEQLFFAGKAYLKINSLVKTPLHEFMAVERSGLWAPDKCKNFVDFITISALRCVITMLHLEVKEDYRRFVFWRWVAGRDKNKERIFSGMK